MTQRHFRIPKNKWVIAIALVLGLVFGNDAIVAILEPLVNATSIFLPAN